MLAASGAVFAAAAGKGTQECVASALFVGAAVLIAINALGETGMRDRGVDPVVGMAYPGAGSSPQGSFRWVLVGFALIGFGVLTLVV